MCVQGAYVYCTVILFTSCNPIDVLLWSNIKNVQNVILYIKSVLQPNFQKNAQEFISEECTTVNVFCSYIFVCCNSINMYEYYGCYGYVVFHPWCC